MKAGDIAKTAARLVTVDRAGQHGDMELNCACIAAVQSGYLRARKLAGKSDDLDAEDAANLMECLKIARRLTGSYNEDDYIDGAGYSSIAGEIRGRHQGR